MNRLTQFGMILVILLIGQGIQIYFNLPIPSTVIGMIILLLLLIFKLLKLSMVEKASEALLNNLSLLFVPAGVAIMNELELFRGKLFQLTLTILISTIVVMLVTGYTVQILINLKESRD